jgi:Peptidase family M28
MATERNRTLGLAVIGIALVYALTLIAYRLPEPRAPHGGEFSALHAQDILRSLVGDNVPHPVMSEANAHVRALIVQQLTDLGYEVSLQSGFACSRYGTCAVPTNIIARRKGHSAASDQELVLLAAHYDSVPAGPGASDDGLGVAVVLEAARILMAAPAPRHPIVLLISDGEEAGLLGANLFVREHPLAAHVKAVVNLDGRGVSGPSLMFETGAANQWLMQMYGRTIARPITDSLFYTAYRALPNDTDFSAFKAAGMQGFNFAYIGDVGHYHTALDSFANLDLRTLQHQGDNALAAVTALAVSDFATLREGEGVYLDLFSRVLLDWSTSLNLIVAIVVLLSCVAYLVWFVRSGQVKSREILWGLSAALLSIAVAIVLSVGCLFVARFAGRVPPMDRYPWIAYPQGMLLASLACSVIGIAALAMLVSKRAGFWGLWLGVALLLSVIAFALALKVPGVSFVVLLPAGIAVLAGLPGVLALARGAPGWMRQSAALAPLWTGFAVLFPVIAIVYAGLGAIGWPLTTLLLSLGSCLLLPLLAAPAAQEWRRRALLAGGVCVLGGLSLTLLVSTHSPSWPLRVNFEYFVDATADKAYWVAEPNTLTLRTSIAEAGHFSGAARPRFEGSGQQVFFADAPLRALAAPKLEVLSALAKPNGNVDYKVHLQSARNAPVALVVFPERAHVGDVIASYQGSDLHVPAAKLGSGSSLLELYLPPAGLDLQFEAAGAFKAVVFDQSFELPGGEFLQASREADATSTQDGDVTVVQLTVTLDPAAGR